MLKLFEGDDVALEHPAAWGLEQLKNLKTSTLSG